MRDGRERATLYALPAFLSWLRRDGGGGAAVAVGLGGQRIQVSQGPGRSGRQDSRLELPLLLSVPFERSKAINIPSTPT